jgi:hypothetical protein
MGLIIDQIVAKFTVSNQQVNYGMWQICMIYDGILGDDLILFAATVARKFSIGDSIMQTRKGYRNANCSLSIRFHPHNRSSNLKRSSY